MRPWRNSRHISRELRRSQLRILKVFHDDQLQPYRHTPRMQFCEWLRHQHTAGELVLRNILWADELCFTRKGVFNVHNSHLWARDNPHALLEHGFKSDSAGLIRDTAMSPYLLPDRLVARRYRDFSETVISGLLEDMSLAMRQRFWFQHYGAPAHDEQDVQQLLNAAYLRR
jgi:hypothetical protein